jgi:uncharacterized cupin superfamily protein
MRTIGRATAATVVAGLILTGVILAAGGLASSQEGPPSTPPSKGDRPRLLAGAYHKDAAWLMADGSTRETTGDFGEITAVGDGSITIERADGESVTASAGAAACIREDGMPADLEDLDVGRKAVVIQEGDSALKVRSGRPRFARRPIESARGCRLLRGVVHGDIAVRYLDGTSRDFDYDRGEITSITEDEISFTRRDGVSVTLRYDESTFVREKRHAISVGDLEAGDRAMFVSEGGLARIIRCVAEATKS